MLHQGEFLLSPEDARALVTHPYCLWFPALDATDYEELGDSIQAQGLLEPIILLGNEVFDGRHRLKVCLEREVEPRFQDFETLTPKIDPIDWILAKNKCRRHLTADQLLALTTKVEAERLRLDGQRRKREGGKKAGRGRAQQLPPKPAEAKSDTRDQLAQKAGTSRYKAEQALRILEEQPELLDSVLDGRLTFPEAERKLPPKRRAKHSSNIAWDFTRQFASCSKYLARALRTAPSPRQRTKIRERLIEWLTTAETDDAG